MESPQIFKFIARSTAAVCALALSVPALAADWWEAETDHFIVKSRDSEKETRAFAEELERYDGALRTLQNLPLHEGEIGRANKVTIYRFGDAGDIAHLAGAPGSGIAGFYIPRAGASVAFVPANEGREKGSIIRRNSENELDSMSVLKHEYAHHFMMQYFPGTYPRWYVEGYAETLATIRFLDGGSFHIGDPPQYRALEVLQMQSFPLAKMLDANHELTAYEAYQHYGTGWLLSHYLNFDAGNRIKLVEFLKALADGEDSLTAAKRVFGDLKQLESKMLAYRHGKFPGYDVKPADYTPPEVTTRLLPDDEIAFIRSDMRLARGVTKKEAADVRGDIEGGLRNFPDSVRGQVLLAEAAYDSEEYDAADAAAAKALALDPNVKKAWLYRGLAAMRKAKDKPEEAATARKHFAKAASLDRADPRPMIDYYRTYLIAGEPPPEQAIIALEDAYEHSGSDTEYRLLLTRQLVSEERYGDARSVLMPIAFNGHATGESDAEEEDPTPTKLLALIDAKDIHGATRMIDELLDPKDEDEKD